MSETVDLLAVLNAAVTRAREDRKRGGVSHDHREFVPGCFRCDLGRDEMDAPAGGGSDVDCYVIPAASSDPSETP